MIKIKDPSGISSLLDNLKSTTTSGDVRRRLPPEARRSRRGRSSSRRAPATSSTTTSTRRTRSWRTARSRSAPARTRSPSTRRASRPSSSRTPTTAGTKPKNGDVIIHYYSKSSTMKLALEQGEIDMAFRDLHPDRATSRSARRRGSRSTRVTAPRSATSCFNTKRAPTDNLGGPPGDRVPDPAADDRHERLPRTRSSRSTRWSRPGCPGTSTRSRRVYGASPSTAKAKAVLKAAGVSTPVRAHALVHADATTATPRPTSTPRSSGRSTRAALFKVTLKSAEWAQYVERRSARQYGAFQLGWFPDYAGRRGLPAAVLR